MKIIRPFYEIWERDEDRGGMAIIERAGRLCYKSESKGDPESFVWRLIQSKHNSVLEHGDYIFEVGYNTYRTLQGELLLRSDYGEPVPRLCLTRIGGRCIVSGNIRAWRELFALGDSVSIPFIGHFDPAYTQGYGFSYESAEPGKDVRQLRYSDLTELNEKFAHIRQTVHFVCDRAVANEFVRHRTMSFSQESTRFVDYAGKHEIGVIEPCFLLEDEDVYGLWKNQCLTTESGYNALRSAGYPPQKCRNVLNLSTKTELAMTGNLRAWQLFFDQRALCKTGQPHPQAFELAKPLCIEMANRWPGVITID